MLQAAIEVTDRQQRRDKAKLTIDFNTPGDFEATITDLTEFDPDLIIGIVYNLEQHFAYHPEIVTKLATAIAKRGTNQAKIMLAGKSILKDCPEATALLAENNWTKEPTHLQIILVKNKEALKACPEAVEKMAIHDSLVEIMKAEDDEALNQLVEAAEIRLNERMKAEAADAAAKLPPLAF